VLFFNREKDHEQHIQPMRNSEAAIVSRWEYEYPYSFYNMDSDAETIVELLDGSYFSVSNEQSELIGYFCFGSNAQVLGGHVHGLYKDETALDIGLGMHPDLTGKGLGLRFLKAGLDFAREKYNVEKLRLSVATFNHRAIAVYEKAGFKPVQTFMSKTKNDETEFLLMMM
jgi:ribosomal-protein-alanine N-acetyltransferase